MAKKGVRKKEKMVHFFLYAEFPSYCTLYIVNVPTSTCKYANRISAFRRSINRLYKKDVTLRPCTVLVLRGRKPKFEPTKHNPTRPFTILEPQILGLTNFMQFRNVVRILKLRNLERARREVVLLFVDRYSQKDSFVFIEVDQNCDIEKNAALHTRF